MTPPDVDAILQQVDPDAFRRALQEKRDLCLRALAAAAVDFELEQANPEYPDDAAGCQQRLNSLKAVGAQLEKWRWCLDEIDRRLNGSAGALHGSPPAGLDGDGAPALR